MVVLFFLIGYIIIHINDLITKQKEINQKENPIEFAEKVQEIVPKIIEKEENPKTEFSLNEDDLYEINELINTVPEADTLVVLVNGVEIYSKTKK